MQSPLSPSEASLVQMEQVNEPQETGMTHNVIVLLEEELAMHEATLQNLLRRQQALNVEEARRQRQLHVNRLETLQSRRTTLEEARQRHLDLQGEIAEALEKSQERLTRVMVAAGVLQDDEEESTALITEQDIDKRAVVMEETVKEEQADNTEKQEGVCISVPDIHLNEKVMATFLKTISGENIGLGVFLPCLNSANMIHRLMNAAALETLALDKAEPEESHRKEALWKTCLDFLCTASNLAFTDVSVQTNESAESSSPTQQPEEDVLDPNVALCPYELAGECADSFCPYQHIKPRNISEQQILARERLPLPTLKLPDTPSLTDNNTAVLVAAQEEETTPPHSPLRKRRRVENDNDDIEDESVKTAPPQESDDEEESIHTQVQSEDETDLQEGGNDADEADNDESGGDVAMEWNDDFVSLPPMTNPASEEHDDSASNTSSSSHENQAAADHQDEEDVDDHAEVSVQELWWHNDNDIARMKESPGKLSTLRLSLTDWLEVVAGIQMDHVSDENNTSLVAIKSNGYPISTAEAVAVLGRVVDCVRLCVHAGRFELTYALCEFARNSLNNKVFPDSDSMNDSDKGGAIGNAMRKALELLEKSRDSAFNFNSDWRSALCCAFEAEISMAILGSALKLLYERLSNDEEIDECIAEWSECLDKVCPLLSRTDPRPATIQATPSTPTTWKELSKDWEVESKKESREYQDPSLRLETTLESGQKIMDSLAQCPMELLVDEVLKPALSEARLFENNLSEEDPRVIAPFLFKMGYVILGCSQSACARIFSVGDHQGVDSSATVTAIDSSIYHIVTCLANIASTEPLAELCLAPLYALSVSLASTLRRYGKAQRRLEAALNVVLAKGQGALCGGYLIYSELLWSQLIQLRSSLPLLPDKDEGKRLASLSVSTKSEHRTIASTVTAFGVQPNHVTLCGDWNMLKAFDMDNQKYAALAHVRKYCHLLFQVLFSQQPQQRQQAGNSLFCNLWHLPLTEVDIQPMRRPSVPSLAFPQSTMLAGSNVSVLVANNCSLKQLPLTFGLYFPNLQVLKLAENDLTILPDSIGKLSSLADFDVSRNHLQSLPSTIGSLKKLTRLNVSHNDISTMEKSIVKCKSLEELLLTNNPISEKDLPSDLTLRCTHLYRIDVDNREGGE